MIWLLAVLLILLALAMAFFAFERQLHDAYIRWSDRRRAS